MSSVALQVDDDCKRLLVALLELAATVRRDQPHREEHPGGLGFSAAMRQHGLGMRHASALLSIALYGPMPVTELARRHHIVVKTASLIAVELEQAGLIDRRHDPADRRRTILAIAKDKEHVVEQGLARRVAPLQRTLGSMTPTERRGLVNGLERLIREMSR